ncbi:MAG: hypothetical protein ACOCQG_05075 [Candidatus Nanoarchaeia archaeon]
MQLQEIKHKIYSIRGKQVMLSNVLKSDTAIKVSIQTMNAFIENTVP